MKLFCLFAVMLTLLAVPGGSPRIAGQDEIVEPVVVIVEDGGINLTAPIECEVGELVRFDARESNVDALVWSIIPASDDFEMVDENRRAFFSARSPGEYLILIAGAKNGKAFLLHQTLTVTGKAIPDSELSTDIGKWLNTVPDFPAKKAQTLAMASVFRKLAKSDTDLDTMLEATALANSAVIGEAYIENWIPFLESLGKELDRLDESHQLANREAYRMKWLEIASALERFANKG